MSFRESLSFCCKYLVRKMGYTIRNDLRKICDVATTSRTVVLHHFCNRCFVKSGSWNACCKLTRNNAFWMLIISVRNMLLASANTALKRWLHPLAEELTEIGYSRWLGNLSALQCQKAPHPVVYIALTTYLWNLHGRPTCQSILCLKISRNTPEFCHFLQMPFNQPTPA